MRQPWGTRERETRGETERGVGATYSLGGVANMARNRRILMAGMISGEATIWGEEDGRYDVGVMRASVLTGWPHMAV